MCCFEWHTSAGQAKANQRRQRDRNTGGSIHAGWFVCRVAAARRAGQSGAHSWEWGDARIVCYLVRALSLAHTTTASFLWQNLGKRKSFTTIAQINAAPLISNARLVAHLLWQLINIRPQQRPNGASEPSERHSERRTKETTFNAAPAMDRYYLPT